MGVGCEEFCDCALVVVPLFEYIGKVFLVCLKLEKTCFYHVPGFL
jgi:hypothetical protein